MITRFENDEMEPLTFELDADDEDQQWRQLSAAEGYAELKMFTEAHEQLDLLDQHEGFSLEVAVRKLDLYLEEGRWKEAAIYGEILTEFLPDEPRHFMKYATALEELGRTDTAIYVLSLAPEQLERDPEYQYRLAVYELDAGTREEALFHLENAIALDPKMRQKAWLEAKFRTLIAELPWEPRFVASQPEYVPEPGEAVEDRGAEGEGERESNWIDPWEENLGHDDGFTDFGDLDEEGIEIPF